MEINRKILAPNEFATICKVFPKTTLCIAEIYPKNPDMLEFDILSYIWEDWAAQCGIRIQKEHMLRTNIPAVTHYAISGFLNS
jgi:hypothetical protein